MAIPFYWSHANPQIDEGNETLDEDGVILRKVDGSWVYHPWRISQYATDLYHQYYLTKNQTLRDHFFNQTAWLVKSLEVFGDHGVWLYRWDNPFGNETAPWWSAMSQGFGIAACIQAYSLEGDEAYASAAWLALRAYEYEMEKWGVLAEWDTGDIWYEEYADNDSPALYYPQHVLNGYIFSLSATYYVYEFNQSGLAFSLWEEGLVSLKNNTDRFDTGMWFRYSIYNQRAYPDYQEIHLEQYGVLYNITQDPFFEKWRDRIAWMLELPKAGYHPVQIWATSTVVPSFNTSWLDDDSLYEKLTESHHKYWSGHLPCSIHLDLGEQKPVNTIGLYGEYYGASPSSYHIYLSEDNISWERMRGIEDSLDWDKLFLLDNNTCTRYIRIDFEETISKTPIVALDEIVIGHFQGQNYSNAHLSIYEHSFNTTFGCLMGTTPENTSVTVGNITFDGGGRYEIWAEFGAYEVAFEHNSSIVHRMAYVEYGTWQWLNVTEADFF
ncbi:MAG: discoidin domain-containing protein [Thermoplasmata archaeon]|nr:discoidin domain-containing protein [Thermoplasmata archaeon]